MKNSPSVGQKNWSFRRALLLNMTVEDLITLLQKQDKTLQVCRYILGRRHLLQEVIEGEYKILDEETRQWKTVKVVDVQ